MVVAYLAVDLAALVKMLKGVHCLMRRNETAMLVFGTGYAHNMDRISPNC